MGKSKLSSRELNKAKIYMDEYRRECEREEIKRITGLYGKFIVQRTDQRDKKGQKHYGCQYFVLDITHDRYASACLALYAELCRKDYPELSSDLRTKIEEKALREFQPLQPAPKGLRGEERFAE